MALLAPSAFANDTSVGGTGVDLYSIQQTAVRMQAEEIVLTAEADRWNIVATYTFENPSDHDVQLQVGFPEVGCPKQDDGDCHAKAFQGLTTEVDGKPVTHRKGSLAQTERWAEHLGKFWLFDVNFSAKKKVTIVHRYQMDATIDSMGGRSVFYVTRTGSTWAGPIGHAIFRFRVPAHATFLQAGEVLGPPKNPTLVQDGQLAHTEVVFEKKAWTPKGDLSFSFATAFGQFPVPRLSAEVLSERVQALKLKEEDQCPRTSIHGLETIGSEAQAQSCRNLVYARWGHPFKKEVLNALYHQGGKGWHPAPDYGPRALTRDPTPMKDFSMAWTTLAERQFLKAIQVEGDAPEDERPTDETLTVASVETAAKTTPHSTSPSDIAKAPVDKKASPPPAKAQRSSGCSMGEGGSPSLSLWAFLLALCAMVRRVASRDVALLCRSAETRARG
jgi:hypothetical protein